MRIQWVLATRVGTDSGEPGQRRLAQPHGIVQMPQAFVDQLGPLGEGATTGRCGGATDCSGGGHASRLTTAAGVR